MTIYNSNVVEARLSDPSTFVNAKISSASVNSYEGIITFDTAPLEQDKVRILSLPVDTVVSAILFGTTGFGAGVELDLIVARAAEQKREVDQTPLFALAEVPVEFPDSGLSNSVRYTNLGIETAGKELWDAIGLTEKPPYRLFDFIFTFVGGPPTIGTISMEAIVKNV